MSQLRVLVVEDDPGLQKFLVSCLRKQDYQVVAAGTGKEALSLAHSHNPDLVLLDLGLPDVDGLQVLQAFRAWSQAPVVILSARNQDDQKAHALDAGADDYLTKPFDFKELLAKKGALADLIASGARIMESACGFCIGNHFSPKSGGVSIRTSNRNFEARSGTKDAQVYLTSPEVAAIAAITGKFTDPRKTGEAYPQIKEPAKYLVDDSMFIRPTPELKSTAIFRGPNIGEPPRNEKLPQSLSGEAAIKVGEKITTDHIMPAGARLKYRSNVPKYAEFVFENVDVTFPKRCLENKAKGIHNIIVAGESYGQGSSREHAAMCPMYLGVKAVIAKSFERIHAANLINFGIAPLVFKNQADYDSIEKGDTLSCENWRDAIAQGQPVIVKNSRTGAAIELLEVDYPSASFGAERLAAGEVFRYSIQVRGNGPLKVEYTGSDGRQAQMNGPTLTEHQEGQFQIVLLPGGGAEFHPQLAPQS